MKKCKVKCHDKETKKDLWIDAEFLGIFQRSGVKQALLIGEIGGVIARPVAVVELEGKLLELNLEQVKFGDVAE